MTAAAPDSPGVVTVHLWGVHGVHIAGAALAMARERRPLRRQPGLRFAKLLGTGSGTTFDPRDVDVHHWGVVAVWDHPAHAAAFAVSPTVRRFDARADERLVVRLRLLGSHGRWSGRDPFGPPDPGAAQHAEAVAAITRARIRPSQWGEFRAAVPPVAAAVGDAEGLLLRTGIGEAPVGLQGTFSVWRDGAALKAFAYDGDAHAAVITRTRETGWYAEELFARFAVERLEGRFAGTTYALG